MVIMKLKPEIWNIILLVGLIALTIFTLVDKIQANAELKALKKSYDLLDENLEDKKAENKKVISHLQEVIQSQDEHLASLAVSLEKIEKTIDGINIISDEKKATIISINDADVLTELLTKRYR